MASESANKLENPSQRQPRRRWAKGGGRPNYLRPEDVDQLMIMLVSLMSEVSALRDRLDTHEAVAESGKPVTTAEVEAYQLSESRRAEREKLRHDMLKRMLRIITEEREAVQEGMKPVQESMKATAPTREFQPEDAS